CGNNYLFQNNALGNFDCDAVAFPLTVSNNTSFSSSLISTVVNVGIGFYQITGTATLTDIVAASGDYCSLVGVQENNINSGINIFPNPVADELFITNFYASAEINIYNTLGEKILSREIAAGEKEVKLN